jgi:carbamoyltransferase
MKHLITLGHNASHISVFDNKINNGIELERISRKKSDSQFDMKFKENDKLYISHWFNTFSNKTNKYFNFDDYKNVYSLNEEFTHHDSHAYATVNFFEKDICNLDEFHILVFDGFGNNSETQSVYKIQKGLPVLIDRKYGYKNSLGLMYQYATSYCGMKENQDEYKFLGYESDVTKEKAKTIMSKADILYKQLFHENKTKNNDIVDYVGLGEAKGYWYNIFEFISDSRSRTDIGYFIQYVCERYMKDVIKLFNISNVLCSGGIFYNVKLNNSIMKNVNRIGVYPLAGDQGCGIGVYRYYENKHLEIKDLCIGNRNAEFKNTNKLVDVCYDNIVKYGFVHVVTGKMEFGPRALCNTSTLALPFSSHVDLINKMNKRNTVMPMAPVMLERNKNYFFDKSQTDKVILSDKYMIITYDYKDSLMNSQDPYIRTFSGVSHKYPLIDCYSGRPQFVNDGYISILLDKVEKNLGIKALINTSYNVHGRPIVYSEKDALDDFYYQNTQTNVNCLVTTFNNELKEYVKCI